jgi:MFS family permease
MISVSVSSCLLALIRTDQSSFLYALDQLILATATPKIVTQFNALNEVAWLTNGFFITLCGFTLSFAQYLDIFASKWVRLSKLSGMQSDVLRSFCSPLPCSRLEA